MTRKAAWPKGTEVQKVTLNLPSRLVMSARLRSVREKRTLQELVAEALGAFLRKSKGAAE